MVTMDLHQASRIYASKDPPERREKLAYLNRSLHRKMADLVGKPLSIRGGKVDPETLECTDLHGVFFHSAQIHARGTDLYLMVTTRDEKGATHITPVHDIHDLRWL